jgi:hypothetical protein
MLVAAVLVVGSAPAWGQVAGSSADFAASATSSVIHVDAIQSGNMRLADVEVAFSGATAARDKLSQQVTNEMQRVVQPSIPGKVSYGRGSGAEIGAAISPSGENQVVLAAKVESSALPSTDLLTKDISVPLAPLAYVGLARGQSQARWESSNNVCDTLGSDISYGSGYASDVQLLDTAGEGGPQLTKPVISTDHPSPERAVSQSVSRTILVPQVTRDGQLAGPNFGILSETRQTIAPVTLFRGTANQVTIEFLGEWVMQAVANGTPGGAYVHYGPDAPSPETAILRVINAVGQVTNILKFQQLLGNEGLNVNVPGVLELSVGEDPRSIGGDATSAPSTSPDGTFAAAAVDVVRVKLLDQNSVVGGILNTVGVGGGQPFHGGDVRVGHMEVSSRVPAGGIACSLPVAKSASSASAPVGSLFSTNIKVSNPFDCAVENVSVTDAVSVERAARFAVEATNPMATSSIAGEGQTGGSIVWGNIGSIASNGSRTVSTSMRAQGGDGVVNDKAMATGTLSCPASSGLGRTKISGLSVSRVALAGPSAQVRVGVGGARVSSLAASETPMLPRTGYTSALTAALGFMLLSLGAVMLESSRRRKLA